MSERLFNDNWSFMLKPVGSKLADAQGEQEWHDVEVPHDWLIGDTHNLYKSDDGWYRKTFTVDKLTENDVYILRFDGIYMDSTVYVNGEEAGGRKYGYSCFSLDITDKLREGENTIYVRVRYQAPNSRWYSGAGIYRNVVLRHTNKLHIKENGVYISSRKYDENNKWIVIIETESSGGDCEVRHRVFDSLGRKCAEVTFPQKDGFSRSAFYAVNPESWDIETPVSYKMVSEIIRSGEVLDSVSNTFGFRTTEFDPDGGFLLNGRRMKLHGVCMHHDLGALGSAVNENAIRRQLRILKSFGVNAVRTSHNMPAKELIDLCTELGLLVDSECYDMWEIPKTEFDNARFFKEHYMEDVESWVTRDRNAPCVIMWSIGNEIFDTHKDEHGLEIAQMLLREVTKHDKYGNAACTIGSNYMRWENARKVADLLKIAGYNYSEDLYDGHHEAYPDWFIYGSETASTTRSRGIYHFPADESVLTHIDMQCSDYGNSVVGWGKASEQAVIDDRDRPFVGGQFVWTGFDYIGEPTPYSSKNSFFGIVDTAGFPKDSYYMYKAAWGGKNSEPFVHLFPYWDFNIGEEIAVRAYSNMPEVELRYNGRSMGRQHIDLAHGDRFYCEWTLRYRKGTIVATAYDSSGNEAATDMICSFGDPESIDAIPDKYLMHADGRDLIFIEINVVDSNGVIVENARNRVRVTVDGAARLVGLDNGDSTDYDSYKGDNRRLFSGKLLAIIQSTLEPGEVTVSIKSEGLWGKELVFTSLETDVKPEGVSVVPEYYPKVTEEYKPETPLRKIEMYATRSILEPETPAAGITARCFPENADYKDIEFSCILPNGAPIALSEIEKTDYGAKITGKGDGSYVIRAYCKNGTDIPQIYSEIHMMNSGFGSLALDPYTLISPALSSYTSRPVNIIERSAVVTGNDRLVFGFNNIDFGSSGSDIIRLFCGYNEGGTTQVELWLGNPDESGSTLAAAFDFEHNGMWEGFAPQEFRLPQRLRGNEDIALVFNRKLTFGGFEFAAVNRAYDKNYAADNDEIYGDVYRITGLQVTDIGNNVIITFKGLDFGEDGASKITICGKTPNALNSVQLRYTGTDGVQHTQLMEFSQCYEYAEQGFPLEKIKGVNDVSFVFMPGSRFDFDWFKFDK
ncbi:MAG: DUF4982 domain-containing protein [Ruminiclostridium sp.]|nr:DUF4982 domain-containing protein [Ruminiclostridium sp.]